MIYLKLMGGLGNQMFQYAYAKQLSMLAKMPIEYFYVHTNGETNWSFALDCFNLKITKAVSSRVNFYYSNNIFYRYFWKKLLIFQNKLLIEKSNTFNTCYPKKIQSDFIILDGYWQSYKYFTQIHNLIRADFTFNKKINKKSTEIEKISRTSNSVSIHIRRGDYLTNIEARSYLGVNLIEYYKKAIEYILNKIKNPVFFFFSDDIGWVKKNFQLNKKCYFIDWNKGINSWEDMRLMNLCKHNIIANSSFSWWGTYLNNNKEKIVIAPKRWFVNERINTIDLIPLQWIKM